MRLSTVRRSQLGFCQGFNDFYLFIYLFSFFSLFLSFESFAIGFGRGLQSHFMTIIPIRCQNRCTLVSSSFFVCLPCLGDGMDFSLFSRDFLVLWILFMQWFSSHYCCGTIIFVLIGYS